MADYHIKIEDLGKTYGGFFKRVEALKSLSLEVPAGTIMGFLGRNGAGKTTTIQSLLGLVRPTRGTAWLLGIPITDPKSRDKVSYMPETAHLGDEDAPADLFAMIGKLAGMPRKEARDKTETILNEVGLAGCLRQRFSEMSKGMKQRVELAQALFTEPELLILDEPFSGLDPIGRREIRDLIIRRNKERGTTVFFSSHILTDVEVMCDSIGILDHGELKAIGQKEDLLGLESVEVVGEGVDATGMMFIEKTSDNVLKKGDRVSVFVPPDQNHQKVVDLLNRYKARNVKVIKHHRALEEFFSETVT